MNLDRYLSDISIVNSEQKQSVDNRISQLKTADVVRKFNSALNSQSKDLNYIGRHLFNRKLRELAEVNTDDAPRVLGDLVSIVFYTRCLS